MFLFFGVLLFIAAYLVRGAVYTVQLYDTYYIVSWTSFFGFLGLFCCLVQGVYYWLNRIKKPVPTSYRLIHIVGTVISIGLLFYSQADFLATGGLVRRYTSISDVAVLRRAVNLGASAILLFIIVQVFFLVGILKTLLYNRRTGA